MFRVEKAENGYVIWADADINHEDLETYDVYEPKKFVASSVEELLDLIGILVPLLDEEYSSEDEFEKAFEKFM